MGHPVYIHVFIFFIFFSLGLISLNFSTYMTCAKKFNFDFCSNRTTHLFPVPCLAMTNRVSISRQSWCYLALKDLFNFYTLDTSGFDATRMYSKSRLSFDTARFFGDANRRRRRRHSTSSPVCTGRRRSLGWVNFEYRDARDSFYFLPSPTNSRIRPATYPDASRMPSFFTTKGKRVSGAFPLLSKPSGVIQERFRTCSRRARLVNKGSR